ncbi:MAG: AAA family ATPase [Chloroflexota bacterium]
MTSIKNAPNQPYLDTSGKWDWELEETLVDRRRRWPNRIRSVLGRRWLWIIIAIIFIYALLDAQFMTGFLKVMGTMVQIGLFLSIGILQFVAIFWFMGRSRMYTVMPGAEGVNFDDYRGQPELLEQAQQMVTLLRGVKAFEGSGGEPLNGLLLEGPPGTGKTWLAKAISTEAGVPFFYVDTSSLQGMFMGTSTLKVSGMYNKARKAAKMYGAAVIFLDEIDSVGARGGVSQVGGAGGMGGMGGMFGGMGGGDMGILSTLLIEMSGFGQEHGWRSRWRTWFYKTLLRRDPPKIPKRVLTIGATNRISALDPALLRPGRFDKKIRVEVPDMAGRREIFSYYLSKMAHDESMDPAILATETPGYSPADIKYLLNDSLRHGLFNGRTYVTYEDFRMAQPEHEMGLRSPLKHIAPEARKRLAYYHAGKAVAIRLFQPDFRIARITIVRQGQAFGHIWAYPAREAYQGMMTKKQWLNRLKVAVAGKASEIEFAGLANQSMMVMMGRRGGGGDFDTIRSILNAMALAGMFGPLGGSLGRAQDAAQAGSNALAAPNPAMAKAMDEMFQSIMVETRKALREHGHIVEALVKLLLEKEELLADEVRVFFDEYGLHTPDPTAIVNGEEFSLFPDKKPVSELVADFDPPSVSS